MKTKSLIILAMVAVAIAASGCSKRETIVITIDAASATNTMLIKTNGYTVLLGKSSFGTNFSTNAAKAP